MATRELVKDALTSFCQVWNKPLTDELVEAYFQSLKRYRDKDVMRAGWKCLEDMTFMPRPHDIISRIPPSVGGGIDGEGYRIHSIARCECGNLGSAIEEPIGSRPRCRECYTGLSGPEIHAKFKALTDKIKSISEEKKHSVNDRQNELRNQVNSL